MSISPAQGGAQVSVALPLKFTNACFTAFTTVGGRLNSDSVANVYTKSTTTIVIGLDAVYESGAGVVNIDWCAIGW